MGVLIKKKHVLAVIIVAIIIGIICIFIYGLNYHQPETKLPPVLIAKTTDGQEVELLLLSYDWNYNGEQKTYGEGLDVKSLTNYNFAGKNTIIRNVDVSIDTIKVMSEPKYRAKTFDSHALTYNYQIDEYESGNGSYVEPINNKTGFSYVPNGGTTLITYTLYSEKQGRATYALKIVNQYYSQDLTKVKEIKNLELNKDVISNFLSEETFGRFLNDVKVDNNKVSLTYDYFISKEASLVFANELFALIDDLEEIEFRFSFNKYLQNVNDPITYEHTEIPLDSVEPIVYTRNSFVDTTLDLTLEELRAYIGK